MLSSNGLYDDSITLEEARLFLYELHQFFPFADWVQPSDNDGSIIPMSRSLAVQIAAMLSQFAGGCVPPDAAKMGIVYNANVQRSGKTLLANIAVIPVYGAMNTQSWNPKDEEIRKVLDAEVMGASTYVVFDNVRGFISSPVLEGFMTAASWTGRVLGRSQMFTAANNVTVFITGNDVSLSPDLTHRCMMCDLFVAEANPQERKKPGKIIDPIWLKVPANRHRILSCLWAIVRHWDAADRPTATSFGYRTRPGFETWGDIIGGMVAYAGFGDCLVSEELESAGDTEWSNMKDLITRLSNIEDKKSAEYTFQEIVNLCYEEGLFTYLLDGREVENKVGGMVESVDYVLKPDSNSRFGKLLQRFAPFGKQPRVFKLPTVHQVKFSSTGKGRSRRFIVEKVS